MSTHVPKMMPPSSTPLRSSTSFLYMESTYLELWQSQIPPCCSSFCWMASRFGKVEVDWKRQILLFFCSSLCDHISQTSIKQLRDMLLLLTEAGIITSCLNTAGINQSITYYIHQDDKNTVQFTSECLA